MDGSQRIGGGLQVTLVGSLLLWLVFVVLLAAIVLTLAGERNVDALLHDQGDFIGRAALELTEGMDTRQDAHAVLSHLQAATPSILFLDLRHDGVTIARVPAISSPALDDGDDTTIIEVRSADGRSVEVGLATTLASTTRLRTTVGTLVSMGIVFVLMSVFIVQIVGRVVGRPVVHLQAQATRLAAGDVDSPPTMSCSGELGTLAESLASIRLRMQEDRQLAASVSEELRRTNSLQRLMLRELNHRVRNNLASLSSLIGVSKIGVEDVATFADRIGRRVQVMSAVHDLLSETQWSPVDLGTLLQRLASDEYGPRVGLVGDDVHIPATQVAPLAMALQEMFSNAAEHGALSSSNGRLDISWDLVCTAEDTDLEISWRERGGPAPDAAASAHTGTTLIRGLIDGELRGKATLRYAPDGVAHLLRFPLQLGSHVHEV